MSYHRFLSWDCANKTLAHAYITVDGGILGSIRNFLAELKTIIDRGDIAGVMPLLTLFKARMDNFIVFHSVAVTDILLGGKVADADEVKRSTMLRNFLRTSSVAVERIGVGGGNVGGNGSDNISTKILIEHQPSKIGAATNNKSTMIGHQLMFYYSDFETHLVSPKIKNTLFIDPSRKLDYYIGSCASEYYARKKHSKEMFLGMVKIFGWGAIIKGIPMSCMDDLADAVMQTLAFMKINGLFV
jgi:hypothetical protein